MKYLFNLFFVVFLFTGISVPANAETSSTKNNNLPLEQLRNFSDIFARIKSDYVEEVDDKTLLENAIRGMLSGLDPHSTYLNPEEYKELKIGTTGQFGGLGIQVGMEDGFVKVISPIDDTPAFRAGIKAGDLIIRLNEKPVKGMTLNDAVNIMRGKPGTEITLIIIRGDNSNPLTFTIKRDIIKVKSVKSRLLEKDFGYVRVSTFQSRTATHLKEAIDSLNKKNESSLKGLVLDLRNNPGGVLNAAADVSDLFLSDGLIVYTKGRVQNSYFEFKAKSNDILNKAPIVVLINGGSASASEIVAGALQDQKRAVIMGSKSFGKGSVQTIQELRNGGAVKFTTARYFTPSGRSIQADGIEPDISLDHYKLSASEDNGLKRIKEADLTGHISNPDEKTDPPLTDKADESKQSNDSMPTDYQINEALNLLKGLSIYSQNNTKR
ncbi:MAG: S41 family peptidase [Gammaproteobacteria bacterium]|nr:S41 family peptidase [Gammaproteobacteria bacterium]MCW8910499.1 S41 family peptidase [Gammaproteobacteria bacterium]MCW9004679.1 S41 family peptidase [Gammaproteobacteria bacterium]MCW9055655.1 S41 family peptidase [Gammaproteobacteria bacterium]